MQPTPHNQNRRYHGQNRRYHGQNRRYHGQNRRYHGQNRRYHGQNRRYHGVTLIELMVAVALTLIVMIGVQYVFDSTTRTFSISDAQAELGRDSQSLEQTLQYDIESAASDAPFMMIVNRAQPGWADEDTFNEDNDGQWYTLPNPTDPTQSDIVLGYADVNSRIFRQDMLAFFGRGEFYRRTGGDTEVVTDLSSPNAYIWWGHLSIPSGSTWYDPGAGDATSNPRNYYAQSWQLGRVALLMRDRPGPGTELNATNADDITDLSVASQTTANMDDFRGMGSTYTVRDSRLDIVRASPYSMLGSTTYTTNAGWLNQLYPSAGGGLYRFRGDPARSRNDGKTLVHSGELAQMLPIVAQRATHFIVEYAGDYLTQNADGDITALQPDGVIDFRQDPTTDVRKTVFYGRPRDANGDRVVRAADLGAGSPPLNTQIDWLMQDVVPLSDYYALFKRDLGEPLGGAPHEVTRPQTWSGATPVTDANADYYLRANLTTTDSWAYSSGTSRSSDYICVFTDADEYPKLLRILIKLEDDRGKLADGRWLELVVRVRK